MFDLPLITIYFAYYADHLYGILFQFLRDVFLCQKYLGAECGEKESCYS